MQLPTREQILAEAIKLYFHRNKELPNYNNPEVYELQEAGLLTEARNKLMQTGRSIVPPVQTQIIAHSSNQILNLKGNEKMETTVEEWRKKDPYMLDIDGFLQTIKEKENEVHVQATVDLNSQGGFYIWLQIPYDEIPDSYKTTEDFKEKEHRIQELTHQIEKVLGQLKIDEDGFKYMGNQPKDYERPKGKLLFGSTDVFKYRTLKLPPPPDMVIETDEDLRRYISRSLRKTGIFTYEEYSTSDSKSDYIDGKTQHFPNDSIGYKIYKSALQQPNKKDFVDKMVEIDFEARLRPFKKGEWYYMGDEAHEGEQDIRQNAEILWQIGNSLSSFLPIISMHKDYSVDRIYLGVHKQGNIRLPPFESGRTSIRKIIYSGFNYEHKFRELKIEPDANPLYEPLATLVKAMLLEGVPNTDDIFEDDYTWLLDEDRPLEITAVWTANMKELLDRLREGRVDWDPEYDDSIWQNGGLEIIHPYLRTHKTLVWGDDIEWSEEAQAMKELYYRRYGEEELQEIKNERLELICKAKELKCARRRGEMIQAILESAVPTN